MLLAPVAATVTVPLYVPVESPLTLAPRENDPLFVPDAAGAPLSINQGTDDVAVHVSVPVPVFVTVTTWPDGLVPL